MRVAHERGGVQLYWLERYGGDWSLPACPDSDAATRTAKQTTMIRPARVLRTSGFEVICRIFGRLLHRQEGNRKEWKSMAQASSLPGAAD